MIDWFDQESVLYTSRSKIFKYQVKLQGEPEENSLALGNSTPVDVFLCNLYLNNERDFAGVL